jgi:hypothetical protein
LGEAHLNFGLLDHPFCSPEFLQVLLISSCLDLLFVALLFACRFLVHVAAGC